MQGTLARTPVSQRQSWHSSAARSRRPSTATTRSPPSARPRAAAASAANPADPPSAPPLGFPVLLASRQSALTGAPIRCVSLPVRGILGGGGGALGAPLPSLCGSHVLLLDETNTIASVFHPASPGTLTGAYWDTLAAIEPLLPKGGAIAIAGLAGGTAAHVAHRHAPSRALVGYELDPDVVAVAREHMGLAALEAAGALRVVVGDAFAATAPDDGNGGFAAIFVDLFWNGLLPESFARAATWEAWLAQLAPGGRMLVNLSCKSDSGDAGDDRMVQAAFDALAEATDGELSVLDPEEGQAQNVMALTGPMPGPEWRAALPARLRHLTDGWCFAQVQEEEQMEGGS